VAVGLGVRVLVGVRLGIGLLVIVGVGLGVEVGVEEAGIVGDILAPVGSGVGVRGRLSIDVHPPKTNTRIRSRK
jgi:hypothetical protein